MSYYDLFSGHVPGLKAASKPGEYVGRCPFHEDKNPSWNGNVETGAWLCRGCGAKGGARDFAQRVGAERGQRTQQSPTDAKARWVWRTGNRTATYSYTAADGALRFQVGRFEPPDGRKFFLPRTPDKTKLDGWYYGLTESRRVLYGLAQLQRTQAVVYVEGEKDVETLKGRGVWATTHAGGVDGMLTQEMLEPLRGKDVVLIPDNDEPGRKLMKKLVGLLRPLARTLKWLTLPGVPEKGDVTDWFLAGGAQDDFMQLLASAPPAQEERPFRLLTRPLADVVSRPVPWLWYPYLPLGRLTILEGDPGQGKSWYALALATSVSLGGWAVVNEGGENLCEPADVIYLTCEDDPEDTIKSRATTLQLDQRRVHIVDGVLDAERKKELTVTLENLPTIAEAIGDLKAKLLIIDPIQAYLPRGVDMNKAEQVRQVMKALQEVARRHECAILMIRHFSKGNKDTQLYRGMGSIDFTGAARSVLQCAQRLDLSEAGPCWRRRYGVVHTKFNAGPQGPAVEFELKLNQFLWVGATDLTAEQLFAPRPPSAVVSPGMLQAAKGFLLTSLNGDVETLAAVLIREAKKLQIPELAVLSAAQALFLVARVTEDGLLWSLRGAGATQGH